MKKIITGIIGSVLIGLMAGCNNQETDVNLDNNKDIESVISEIDDTFKEAKNGKYKNIQFDILEVDVPADAKIQSYTWDVHTDEEMSVSEKTEKWTTLGIEKIMGEINYEYLYDGGHHNPDAPDVITYEMLLDGTAQITAEEFDSLYYKDSTNNKKCELIMGYMSNFSAGAFGNIVGKPITFGYQSYLDYVDTYKVHRDNLDVTYKLADGEITIAQAIENAETYYNSIFPLFTENNVSMCVNYVEVYKFKDSDNYVLDMYIGFEYAGLRITEFKDALRKDGYDANKESREGLTTQVIMVETDKIDMGFGVFNCYEEPVAIEEYKEIVTLDGFLTAVSERLSDLGDVDFIAEYVGMEYQICSDLKEENAATYIVPYWSIKLKNPMDNKHVYVYAEVDTGEISSVITK